MRRIVISLLSLFAVVAAFLSTGSAAFAMPVAPLGGSSVDVAPAVHHSGGLALWQVGLIVVAGVAVLIVAALGARLVKVSRRHAPASATS